MAGITGRLLAVVLIVVVPMVSLLTVTTIGQMQDAKRDAHTSAQRNVALAAQAATAQFASVTDLLRTISSFPSVQTSDIGRCFYILGQMAAKLDSYASITVAAPDGTVICGSAPHLQHAHVAQETWFDRALHHDGPVIGDMTRDEVTGEKVIHVAEAMRSRFDNVLRVVSMSVRVSVLERFASGVRLPEGGEVVFIDSAAAVMARAATISQVDAPDAAFLRRLREEALSAPQAPVIVQSPAGGSGRFYTVETITSLFGAPVLAIGLPPSSGAERQLLQALLQGMILLASAALAAATAVKIGQHLIRHPIRRLEQAARRVGTGDFDVRLGPPYSEGELGALSRHFDAMVGSLSHFRSEVQNVNLRLEQLMKRLPVGVFRYRWAPEFGVELVNDAMPSLLGIPRERLLQLQEHWALAGSGKVDHADLRAAIDAAIAEGRDYELRYQMVAADGRLRWFLEKGGLRFQNGATHVEGLLADITGTKREEESLRDEYERLVERSAQAIASIATIIETRDPYTAGHSRRVTHIAVRIAEEMGLSRERIDGLRLAGLVHDIGKISVPIEFLTRPVKLSQAELNVIRQHAASGYEILKGMDWPWPVAQIVRQHHERLDGKGYPDGLVGDQILLEAQILAVADTAEAMTWDRPYRKALPISELERVLMSGELPVYNRQAAKICLKLLRNELFTHTLYAEDGSLPPAA